MQSLSALAPLLLAFLARAASAQYGGQCNGGAAPVQVYVCANPVNCCQQVQCPAQSVCQPRPAQMQACCCPAPAAPVMPAPPPQPVIIPVVTAIVPPGAPCPLPYQQCGGGSTCQYTLNLAVCTCPGGQTACEGQCQSGGCGSGAVAMGGAVGGCIIGAGDWCGPSSAPRCNCVPNAQCGPHTGAGIYLCLCNPGFWRRGKACLPY